VAEKKPVSAAATVIVYGIPNCDTVKKARTWLDDHGIAYAFHDYKKAGVSEALLRGFLQDVALDTLVNRRGQTYRALTDAQKAATQSEAGAIDVMVEKPSVIKRPVVVADGRVQAVGFSADHYETLF
jgi:arsenate reductase